MWGTNPHASGIHFVPVVQRALGAGAKLVVVDPRVTKLARAADLHVPVRPGTDGVSNQPAAQAPAAGRTGWKCFPRRRRRKQFASSLVFHR